ncbi:MAG: hypothetical protein A2Z32_06425 [Chloroflexi bacterium RBG_16_69_14]|nr:MAG: hypothetical protein A2Z32_06425 [Chloroflexi bacterium RBG_16_69_14]
MQTFRPTPIAERLAATAALVAALAALAGFVPGLYRDPQVVVAQSHGQDLANLVGVLVFALGLAAWARGSLRGRLIAIGALGYLFYSYVAFAFLVVLNPATVLYIAVLGFAGWSFAFGFAAVDDGDVEAAVDGHLARRATGVFLIALGLLFGATWLGQIAGSVTSGHLPADLVQFGWPMNPYFVLDLGFLLPLMALAGIRLLTNRPGGARLAVPLLVFAPLMALSILLTIVFGAADGQALEPSVLVMFGLVAVLAAMLAGLALDPRPRHPASPLFGSRPA